MRNVFVLTVALFTAFFAARVHAAQWFKGNLHMHSLWSDGDAAPEMSTDWYKTRGWHFICYTDHNILLEGETFKPIMEDTDLTRERVDALREQFGNDWIEEEEYIGRQRMRLKTFKELRARFEEPGRFLLIHGEEITTLGGNPHVVAVNVIERTGGQPKGDVAEIIRQYKQAVARQEAAREQPMLTFLAHPNWSDAVTVEEALRVEALRHFEVFNGHRGVNNWGHETHGYPSTDRFWDIVLAMRLREDPDYILYGLATDDAHNYHVMGRGANPGRGWVMARAEELTPGALIAAIKSGDFYASTGVHLQNIRRDESGLAFEIIAEPGVTYTTLFLGTRAGFNTESKPALDENGAPKERASNIYSDEIGVILAETTSESPAYVFSGDELYARAKIISDRLHPNPFREGDYEMAWTQPVIAP